MQSADLLKGFNDDYETECDILAEVPSSTSDFCGKEFVINDLFVTDLLNYFTNNLNVLRGIQLIIYN